MGAAVHSGGRDRAAVSYHYDLSNDFYALARCLYELVRPQGRVLVQQMSRRGGRPGGGEFIEAYIAPDMDMRPVGETVAQLEQAGLEVRDVHGLREHYVRAARAWLATLERGWDEVVAMVGERTARAWRLYLAGGALTFDERRMGVDQILAVRSTADGVAGMSGTRGGWKPAGA